MVLTVDEVKQHLRIDQDEEDSLIEGLIRQAQAAAEDFCRVSFDQTEAAKPASEPMPEPATEPVSDANNEPNDEPVTASESAHAPVPEPVRLACLLFVSYHYENRDIPDMTTYKSMRMAFERLLYPYRDPAQMF